MRCPLIQLAFSEHKKATTPPMSSASPTLPKAVTLEMMATLSADYDMARFGAEVVRFSPRQSDVMLIAG